MPERLHVLLIEDNAGDARYIQELLEEAQEFTTRSIEHGGRLVGDDAGRRADSGAGRRGSDGVVSTGAFVHETRLDDGLARLDERSFDVVLLDLNLPDSTGIDTVRTLLDHEDLVPVVVLTGLRDRETGIEALREGADEYLVKDEINPDLLIRSVIHAIERKAHEREQRRYETLVEESTDANAIVDPDGTVEFVTPSVEYALGYRAEELIGESCFDYVHPEDREAVRDQFARLVEDPDYRASTEFRFKHADGSWIVLHARGRNLLDDPAIDGLVVYTHEITEQKEYERELERQRADLSALNQLNGVVNGVTRAVIDRSTREEIKRTTCDRIAASASYAAAWIGEPNTATGSVDVHASDGLGEAFTPTELSKDAENPVNWTLTADALRSGEVATARDVALGGRTYPSAAAVPVPHADTVYGVLTVYTERGDAFRSQEVDVLEHLGGIVGHAIAAADRKQALMSDTAVELEFRIPGVFAAASVDTPEEPITIQQTVSVDDGYRVFGTATPDAVDALAATSESVPHWESVEVVTERGDSVRFELHVSEAPVVSEVAELGGTVEALRIDGADLRLTVRLPDDVSVRSVIDTVRNRYPDAEAVARRQVAETDTDAPPLGAVWHADLTERQRTVLRTAYFAGYFEWPREASGEEVADALDIAPATFSEHLRAAQNAIFDGLLEGDEPDASD